mgnify:CR=1 FL=1
MIREFEKRLITSLILIPISMFFIIKGSIFFIFFLIILFFGTIYEWAIMSKKNDLLKFLGIIFLFFSFYTAFELGKNYEDFLFIVIICIFTDIGGYIFGKIFKGPKLTKISPKKTYAGVFGGFLLSLTAGFVFWHYFYSVQKLPDEDLIIFILILFISLISQIGDLIISYFKRKANIKDTGNILPGHGGLLDRIDGIVFVIPVIYLLGKI